MAEHGDWRYQSVWIAEDRDTKVFGLTEVYLDDADRLTRWTEDPFMVPQGETLCELRTDLARMIMGAYNSWKPVAVASLKDCPDHPRQQLAMPLPVSGASKRAAQSHRHQARGQLSLMLGDDR